MSFEPYRKALKDLKLPPRDPDDPELNELQRAIPIIKLIVDSLHDEDKEKPKDVS